MARKKGETHHNKSKKADYKHIKNKKIIFAILLLIISGIIFYNLPAGDEEIKYKVISSKPYEPSFHKEGELIFFSKETRKKIEQIDIEIADNPGEAMTGLMNRRSMPDSQGMLFIFKKERPLSMWMKNTYISLDMIFIDENYEIVTIQKYTKPLSTRRLPSYKDAMYVVEVVAGFCDKYHIKTGDYILFGRVSINTKRNN